MSLPLPSAAAVALLLSLPATHAVAESETQSAAHADSSVAKKLNAKGTPYTIDADGDYEILVDVGDGRTQLVWVRSVVHETRQRRLREIWTYGMQSDKPLVPTFVANQLLADNFNLVDGSWARQDGNAVLILRIDADADADILDEAIDLAASAGDKMEQQLVEGDEL